MSASRNKKGRGKKRRVFIVAIGSKKVTVGDTEYTLQKIPAREWVRLRQRCTKNGNLNEEKFIDEILEHIVVDPKKRLDDFEDYSELEEVVAEAVNFQHGRPIL
jgi:hypothetical protein